MNRSHNEFLWRSFIESRAGPFNRQMATPANGGDCVSAQTNTLKIHPSAYPALNQIFGILPRSSITARRHISITAARDQGVLKFYKRLTPCSFARPPPNGVFA